MKKLKWSFNLQVFIQMQKFDTVVIFVHSIQGDSQPPLSLA